MKRIRVSAAVIADGDRVLLARRSAEMSRPLKWEFPGGKLEDGESDRESLCRELAEELGIETEVGEYLGLVSHDYEDISIDLAVYRVRILHGEPAAREHSELSWVIRSELSDYDLAEADIPVLKLLE